MHAKKDQIKYWAQVVLFFSKKYAVKLNMPVKVYSLNTLNTVYTQLRNMLPLETLQA
jgi:hypothetical protein